MKTLARGGTTAVAALTFAAAVAGCASESSSPLDVPAAASTGSVTSSPSGVPETPRPLSDFVDGSAEYPYYSFASPSGQLQCRFVDGSLACQTEGHPHSVADSTLCGFYPGLEQGRAVRFGFFSSGPQPCATIIQGDGFRSPHTLAYGQRVTAELPSGRTVTCASAVEGLTCTQTGGNGPRGFFLSVDSFTVL